MQTTIMCTIPEDRDERPVSGDATPWLGYGGGLLFLTGQTASDASGHIVNPGDTMAQDAQVLHNLQTVVEAVGEPMQNMVEMTTFVSEHAGGQ
jgi:enamine deaminase RidA (YjgF/YER057c/UK114 family)